MLSTGREATLSTRTRLSYGLGCIGRDANYTLVNNFILTYLTLAVGVTNWQLGAIGIVMIAARIWDAVNDLLMGTLIDNTRTRWGKFKPYILCGALLNSVFTVLLFTTHVQNEKLFVLMFGITYVLWGMTYTMNDISYWSLLPSLTLNPKEREKATSLARIGANIGLFAVTAAVPALTAGGMGSMYGPIAYVVAGLFIACQILVVVGVQQSGSTVAQGRNTSTSLKDMVRIVFKNDQLLVIAGAILLFNIGYFITTGFGVQFFYFDYGVFGGMEFTLFAIAIGVAQIVTLALYPLLSKRFTRKQLFGMATLVVVVGYLALMAVGYVLPMNMAVMCAIGLVLFAGQAVIQLLNYVLLADTVEYGQWKLGTRNESIVYSLNPFIVKLASSVQAGVFSLTMILSGLNTYANQISGLETQLNTLPQNSESVRQQLIAQGNQIVSQIPGSSKLILRLSMIILPLLLILGCYLIFRAKYRLDEETYANILKDLEQQTTSAEKETAP